MKVLLTGASGFVGSWVLEQLVRDARHEVHVLLRPGARPWRISHLLPQVRVHPVSLDDPAALDALLMHQRFEAVIHLAWAGVAGAHRNDVDQWRNLPAALNLLTRSAAHGAQHWIGLGSQAEYGPCANVIDEHTPEQPTTLYGQTKLATARMACALGAQLGLRVAWLRLFSSYGARDNPGWMIPSLIRALHRGEKPAVTRAQQRWDYIHVSDVARAVVAVLETASAQGVFNLGSGQARPLREVIEGIRDRVAPGAPVGFGEVDYRPDQVMHLQADISRLSAATGWRPAMPLDQGLDDTVAWYRQHPEDPA